MAQRREKVAEIAAQSLRRRILDERLPPGTRLGSQAELIEEMELSRGSAREAMRLLEHQGLVTIKPGPSGGIYVALPDTRTVVTAAANYLEIIGVDPAVLYPARLTLEPVLAAMATEQARRDLAIAERLRAVVDTEARFLGRDGGGEHDRGAVASLHRQSYEVHVQIAQAAGNPPLALCCEILLNLGEFEAGRMAYDRDALRANNRAHVRIVDSIASGDADAAEQRMRKHISATHEWVVRAAQGSAPGARRAAGSR